MDDIIELSKREAHKRNHEYVGTYVVGFIERTQWNWS